MDAPSTKILILSANPRNTKSLRLDEERREIETGLIERSRLRDQFHLITKVAVRPRDCQRAMLDHSPQIVHFSGHGSGERGIALEDEVGNLKLVDAAALAALFALYKDTLQCVVLNACYSEVQAKAIVEHIPYAIGMSDKIKDRAAIEFAVAFYDALGAGRDVEFAYKNARVAIQMAGIPQSDIPVLHKKVGLETQSLQPPARVAPQLPSPQFSTYNPATFAGRDAETAQLLELLQGDCRVVALVGMTGIGKTALAERVVARLMKMSEHQMLPYLRFSLDDHSLTPDFSSSGAALLRTLGEEPTLDDQKDPANLLTHLLDRLCSTPCRVQIDSLERLLRGNEQDGWSEFCDSLWLNLLQKLLAGTHCPSQLLLTSQDIPGDLDTIASRYPQFWHYEPLQGLSAEEQQELFQKLGLNLTDSDREILRRIGTYYDGHPLVLQVIAEEILQLPFEGNITRYWQHYEAEFTAAAPATASKLERSRLFRRRVRQRVEQSLQRLPEPARQMLCACSVFRRPVPVEFWYAMLPEGDPQLAFDTLQDRHLIEFTPTPLPFLIKQHNLIRSVASALLKADPAVWEAAERQAAYLWLTAYQPAPDVPNLETVRGYLEAFDHYCEVGDWNAAEEISWKHMNTPTKESLCQQLGTWGYFREQFLMHKKQLEVAVKRDDQWGEGTALGHVGLVSQRLGQYEQAIDYHWQHLTIAQRIGAPQGEGNALGNLGLTYNKLGQYEQAIDFLQQHLLIARKISDLQGGGNALGNLGLTCHKLGQYERAIDFYQRALTIARAIDDCQGESNALVALGNARYSLGQDKQAIDLLQKALTIAQEIGARQLESSAQGGLGLAYHSLEKYKLAVNCHRSHLNIAREIGDRQGEGVASANMGATQLKLEEYPKALTSNQTALEIFQEIGDRANEAEALRNLAEVHQALGEVEVALLHAQQALTLATELGIPLKAECESLLAELAKGDSE